MAFLAVEYPQRLLLKKTAINNIKNYRFQGQYIPHDQHASVSIYGQCLKRNSSKVFIYISTLLKCTELIDIGRFLFFRRKSHS